MCSDGPPDPAAASVSPIVVEIQKGRSNPPETASLPPASSLAIHTAKSPPPPSSQSRSPPPVSSSPPAPALLPAEGDPHEAGLAVDHPVAHKAPEVEPTLSWHRNNAWVPHPAQPLPGDVIPLLHLQSWCLLMPENAHFYKICNICLPLYGNRGRRNSSRVIFFATNSRMSGLTASLC